MPKHLLTLIAFIAFAFAAPFAEADQKPDLVTSILRDPAAPIGGNPKATSPSSPSSTIIAPIAVARRQTSINSSRATDM